MRMFHMDAKIILRHVQMESQLIKTHKYSDLYKWTYGVK